MVNKTSWGRNMDTVYLNIEMAKSMKVIFSMIVNMESVKKYGIMEPPMKGNTKMGYRMVKENSNTHVVISILVDFKKDTNMA